MTESRAAMPRRPLLSAAALAALPLPGLGGRALAATEPLAETAQGKLRGSSTDGVMSFKGIPYAASPLGAARFTPPQPAAPWAGERDAIRHGPAAPQLRGSNLPVFAYTDLATPQSEDCLTLCIYTPGLRDGKRRPILVWLHGGAWSTGAGTVPVLDGSALAREQDVVVVAVNHRLNLFGFLQDSGLPQGAGNNGVRDMIAALRWVRDNAEAFGGDPGCVTIFGQSGGAAKVSAMMAAPEAKGLFHRAIMQSGSGALRLASPEDAARAAHGLLTEFELRPGDAARLREIPTDRLLAAMAKVVAANGGANNFRPVLDGVVFQAHPFDTAAPAPAREVPLLIGSAETEITFYLAPNEANFALGEEQLRRRVQRFLRIDAATTDRILAEYRAALPQASPSDLLVAIGSDQNYRMGMIQAAELKAKSGGAPAWLYLFDWRSPAMGGRLRTPHTAELPFVFGNLGTAAEFTGQGPELPAVRRRMMALWAGFARTGRPQGPDLPEWPAYEAESRPTMRLGNEARLAKDPAGAERRALQPVPRFEYSHSVTFARD
ncbi:carboxylesterase/lipase family protein [Belnapia sp. T6]|uniref:Carboxylic ester hydrolase n=1 Tax=Belnapia mucosa TaxID=2804532 RepID=A0ABS1V8G9_9PROT|nr:carboxylesterase/lipase family protein [Belnapia mucosa]MBL6457964.1 carboxylesterase/lipase family protein [Belnapia mucosa]